MSNKIIKVILDGQEFYVTDKAAQVILAVIQADIEQMKEDIDILKARTSWRVMR